ncbi:hypothetical protein SAMN05216266_101297 [Amycolatopsis marina]|uniref:Uncharacterized protein n=1 Tax=Amycolatopsis marina TaxID=490629 RepID=A0A1I0VK06_9PSEU|nr:hypothetical protein [Amycolatopsis marina]SFA76528.1 hypothetical protein SAMN05216266_101297 [Amycolatopsis marina]
MRPAVRSDLADDPVGQVRASARGWQGIQLGVLGFIGLCGVLVTTDGPFWLDVLAGILAVVALLLACVATVLVGLVAWPLDADADTGADPSGLTRRLRAGIAVTLAAVVAVTLSALSGWWPEKQPTSAAMLVEVRDVTGRVWCGELNSSDGPALILTSGGRRVAVPAETLASVRPVVRCPD